jgi:hypothetical protein
MPFEGMSEHCCEGICEEAGAKQFTDSAAELLNALEMPGTRVNHLAEIGI